MLPLDVQAAECRPRSRRRPRPRWRPPRPGAVAVAAVAALLAAAERPGDHRRPRRGARRRRARRCARLGELTGAVLATSAVANGLFAGDPYALGIAGGFSSPLAAALLGEADVVVAFGAALNQWTTRHGTLIGAGRAGRPGRPRRRRDRRPPAGRRWASSATRAATAEALARGARRRASGPARTAALAARDRRGRAGATSPYDGRRGARPARPAHAHASRSTTCCPPSAPSSSTPATSWAGRRCTCASRTPPASSSRRRSSASGSGSATRSAPRSRGPDRLTVAALGDGGALMALPELETLGRLEPPLLVVIYDDAAYGAEVHHFRPHGRGGRPRAVPRRPTSRRSPRRPAAAASTARSVDDLDGVREWLAAPRPAAGGRREGRPRHLRGLARGGLPRPLTRGDRMAAARRPGRRRSPSGAVRVVDLTQPLSERTPVLQLPEPFANTPPAQPAPAQPLRRPRAGVGVGRARGRRARRHALRRADPLDHRPRRRGRRERAARRGSSGRRS